MDGAEADAKEMKGPYTVCVIPCKVTSRRLPDKNFQEVEGYPMMLWAVMKAMCCPDIDLVVVSTDNADELMRKAPSFGSPRFDRVILLKREQYTGPDDPIYAVVVETIRVLMANEALERDVTNVVMMQPNVPTIDQAVINRLVAAVVREGYNVARHFDQSGAMTGGCDAYKIGALSSPVLMDSYNFAVFTNDVEVHDKDDLELVRQVMKMRQVGEHVGGSEPQG